MTLRSLPIAAALAILSAGCSTEPYKTAPVTGRITVNGQPVAKAAVMFQPVAPDGTGNPGPGSTGITDEDGRYTLTVVGKDISGAVVGKHKVRITMFLVDDDPTIDYPKPLPKSAAKQIKIPPKYNQQEAALEFDVAKGKNTADFDLTP